MRYGTLTSMALSLTMVTGCTPATERLGGDAAPAGSPRASASTAAPSASSVAATGSPRPSGSASRTAGPTASATRTSGSSGSSGQSSAIRQTDWPNATITNLRFCGQSDDTVRFRDGSNGFDVPCTILPGGARPVYAEFVVEEPANAPSTEDALVLVELGNPGAARRQALVPVQLSDNGRGLYAWPVIAGDAPAAGGAQVMTFTSYRVVGQTVEATVRRTDGGSETRRWRKADGAGNWERF
ncbi:hypothetical protein ACQPZK_18325 [Micromonospora sp. CA-249363]|uniref:hypothetical protein n=1 Tax=Micromonospora sp. CA-249363 TaxID=3239963 RepID=UPI003D93BEF0